MEWGDFSSLLLWAQSPGDAPSRTVIGFWGFVGGLIVEALDLYRVLKNNGFKTPDFLTSPGYLLAVALRLFIGAFLAAALADYKQLQSPAAAVGVGAGAPLVLERLVATVIAVIQTLFPAGGGKSDPNKPDGH